MSQDEIIKRSVFVLVKHEDRILYQCTPHPTEGYDTIDIFGTFRGENESPLDAIRRVSVDLFTKEPVLSVHGTHVNHIRKPSGMVRLEVVGFMCRIDNQSEVLMKDNYLWLTREQVEHDQRARRDWHLLPYFFSDKNYSVELAEDQMARWIDAELLWIKDVSPDSTISEIN